MTPGRLTEFLTYMTLLQSPIRQIAMIFAAAARATTSGGRLFEILDLEPEVADKPDAPELVVTSGVLRFEHVDFAFDSAGPRHPDRRQLRGRAGPAPSASSDRPAPASRPSPT